MDADGRIAYDARASRGTDNMRIEPEIGGMHIVLLGGFSPAVFTPAWFALHELLPESAATAAELKFVHPLAAEFTADWLHLQATAERFVVRTEAAPYVRLRDLAVRVFDLLPGARIEAFDLTRDVHFTAGSLDAKDRIGKRLAPPDPWGRWVRDLDLDGERNGLMSLTMGQAGPAGRPKKDKIGVTVEPSERIGEERYGVYVCVTDRYTSEEDGVGASKHLIECLHESFEISLKRSDDIIDHVMSLAEQ